MPHLYRYGSFSVYKENLFIHAYSKSTRGSNILVYDEKGTYVRSVFECDDLKLNPLALCIHKELIYTIVDTPNKLERSVVLSCNLQGERESIRTFDVGKDRRSLREYWKMLQISNSSMILLNYHTCLVCTVEGEPVRRLDIGTKHLGTKYLGLVSNFTLSNESIYVTDVSLPSNIHRYGLQNLLQPTHHEIIPKNCVCFVPQGLLIISRFIYICDNMKLLVLNQDGQLLDSYSMVEAYIYISNPGLEPNNLHFDGHSIYMFNHTNNTMHLWNMAK